MEEDYKVDEISTETIITKRIDLARTCMATTHSRAIEMQNVGRKWRGGMKGKIGQEGRYKRKRRGGGDRRNGKIDYRVKLPVRGVGKIHTHRDRGEGRQGWEYLVLSLGDGPFRPYFLNGVG